MTLSRHTIANFISSLTHKSNEYNHQFGQAGCNVLLLLPDKASYSFLKRSILIDGR